MKRSFHSVLSWSFWQQALSPRSFKSAGFCEPLILNILMPSSAAVRIAPRNSSVREIGFARRKRQKYGSPEKDYFSLPFRVIFLCRTIKNRWKIHKLFTDGYIDICWTANYNVECRTIIKGVNIWKKRFITSWGHFRTLFTDLLKICRIKNASNPWPAQTAV